MDIPKAKLNNNKKKSQKLNLYVAYQIFGYNQEEIFYRIS